MELLYEKVLDDLLKNQLKLTKTELTYDILNELYTTRVIINERVFVLLDLFLFIGLILSNKFKYVFLILIFI